MIKQKVAIITGASRGIGNAVAVQLAREGYAIAAAGTSGEKDIAGNLDRIRAEGQPLIYIQGNVSEDEQRKMIIERVLESYGRLDVLVNNAGVAPRTRKDILQMEEESMDYVLGINLKGTFFMTQLAANEMIREITGGVIANPMIINISSVSAYASSTQRGEYCISKAGVSMVTQLFADRLAEYGINVYEIRPGVIRTDMTSSVSGKYDTLIENGLTPIKRWGEPEDVANAVSVLCSGKLGFSTGEVINVDGGFHIRRL